MLLLTDWEKIELEQALALLSGFFSLNDEYSHLRVVNPVTPEIIKRFKVIRNMAVKCLEKVPNEILDPISLQLVQALRYEETIETDARVQSGLKEFLFDKAIEIESLAHGIHWHLELEKTNSANHSKTLEYYGYVYDEFMNELEDNNQIVYQKL